MRFLSREETSTLGPLVWRNWDPSRYKGTFWWKLEDNLDVTDILEKPLERHPIDKKSEHKTQYVPYGRLIVKAKPERSSAANKDQPSSGRPQSVLKRSKSTLGQTSDSLRCITLACATTCNRFVTLDCFDNILLFDLDEDLCWKVMTYPGVGVLSFCHDSKTELLLGKQNGSIEKINIEPELFYGHFEQHIFPVKDFLFLDQNRCLSYSREEAWIWNCYTFEALHSLTFKENSPANLLTVLPNSLVATFLSDGTLHLWKPDYEMSGRPRLAASYLLSDFMLEKDVTCSDLNEKGTLMALAGNHKLISIIDIENNNLSMKCVLQLPETATGVIDLKFLRLPNYKNSKNGRPSECLALLSIPSQELLIYDLENSHFNMSKKPVCFMVDVESDPKKFFLLFSERKYALFLTKSFVDVYTTFWWMNDNFCFWFHYERQLGDRLVPIKRTWGLVELDVGTAAKFTLSTCRDTYRRVLHQLGELPGGERCDYWRMGLETPGNHSAFRRLIEKSLSPVAASYNYTHLGLPPDSTFQLARLYSALSTTSPIFYVMEDLPATLLNFCKTLNWRLESIYEIFLTIMINYAADWYTDYPNPPKEFSCNFKNSLAKRDTKLFLHLETHRIDPTVLGWILLLSLFTNVTDVNQWSVLWDHIIFSSKSFLSMVAISFLLNSREIFLSYNSESDFCNFQTDIKNSELNIGSVILMAHDLLFYDKGNTIKNENDSFVAIPKGDTYEFQGLNYNNKIILKSVHDKIIKGAAEEIRFQNTLDIFKVLDPRPYYRHAKKVFVKEENQQNPPSKMEMEEFLNQLEERERELNEENTIEEERREKYSQLLKLLENRELSWFDGQKNRLSDKERLSLYEKYWPHQYAVKFQVLLSKVRPRSEFERDKTKSVISSRHTTFSEDLQQNLANLRRSMQEMRKPGRSTASLRRTLSGGNRISSRKKSILSRKSKDVSSPERNTSPPKTEVTRSGWETQQTTDDLPTLKKELTRLETVVEKIRWRLGARRLNEVRTAWGFLEPWGSSVQPPRCRSLMQLQLDWRKEKRSQFFRMIEQLYERIGLKRINDDKKSPDLEKKKP